MVLVTLESGWFVADIELPIPPGKIQSSKVKAPKVNKVQFAFPGIFNAEPDRFTIKVEGWIWPIERAKALDELLKNPDTQVVPFKAHPSSDLSKFLPDGTLMTVNKTDIIIDGPYSTIHNSVSVTAFKYEIEFIQFSETGDSQDTTPTTITEDELGLGWEKYSDSVLDFTNKLFEPIDNILAFKFFN